MSWSYQIPIGVKCSGGTGFLSVLNMFRDGTLRLIHLRARVKLKEVGKAQFIALALSNSTLHDWYTQLWMCPLGWGAREGCYRMKLIIQEMLYMRRDNTGKEEVRKEYLWGTIQSLIQRINRIMKTSRLGWYLYFWLTDMLDILWPLSQCEGHTQSAPHSKRSLR